jgi:hypothetical protein
LEEMVRLVVVVVVLMVMELVGVELGMVVVVVGQVLGCCRRQVGMDRW